MAGIAGIYCADGRPANIDELRRMTAAVEDRGPDGITYWKSGSVAFAHLQFHTTPESLEEHQPLLSPGGEACLVWNGRIDNREDLLAELTAKGAQPMDRTDPGLALAAYLVWGSDFVQHIVGDFALALWDARQRRLWCARDYIGIRPFFYYWDGKTFLFGPEIRALLAHPLVSLKINEGMVGEYLADQITSRDETLYGDIRRLPPGSMLCIDSARDFRVNSWWNPEFSLLEYRSDEQYAEHFRHLFEQSIRGHIRCNTPWGIELSGGLDSSSIGVTARAILGEGGSEDSRIFTFSMACPGKPWDESDDIAAVAEKASLTPEFVLPLSADLEFFRQRASFWRDYPGNPNGEPVALPMYGAATRHGARVLLSGLGGDEWMEGDTHHMIDLASALFFGPNRGRVRRDLLYRAKAECRDRHWSAFLARLLIANAAPKGIKLRRKKLQLVLHSIFSGDFLQRTQLAERIIANCFLKKPNFRSHAQGSVFGSANNGFHAALFEWNEREATRAGVEVRYPFYDRRFVEFCLRLPEDQRQRGDIAKLLLRNAMRQRLPERILRKLVKADFADVFQTVFRSSQSISRLQDLAIVRHTDWLDTRRLGERLAEWTSPNHLGPWPLWMLFGIDLWFEHLQSSRKYPRVP